MKVIFMGTPRFSVPVLEELNSNHEILAVITQPDKPKGRKAQLTQSPIKKTAQRLGISVLQPHTLQNNSLLNLLETINPEIIVVAAYGKILPKYIIDFPKYGCVNVHASILPKYRGAAPINWSVINGETETGITTMYMDENMDTGDILLTEKVDICANDTAGIVHDKLSKISGKLLIETLKQIENKTIKRIQQNDNLATYAPMLSRETGLIDWTRDAVDIVNLIRGSNPYPIAYTMYDGKKIKIHMAILGKATVGNCGEVVDISSGLEVVAGDNVSIIITEIQPENKGKMAVKDYLNGHKLAIGTRL